MLRVLSRSCLATSKQIPSLIEGKKLYHRALKLIREYHRLSQKDAASALLISKSYLSELEGGKKQPSLEILQKYADFYRIPLSSIMLFAESSRSDSADHLRGFAADKILKILEWLNASNDVDDGSADDEDTATPRLSSLRDRLSG